MHKYKFIRTWSSLPTYLASFESGISLMAKAENLTNCHVQVESTDMALSEE